jgi:lipopolysaccharide transport protein LptA
MAVIPAESRILRKSICLVFLACGVVAAHGAGPSARSTEDIVLDAASSDIDYRANKLHFRDVVISQGDTRIQASEAEANGTGLKFDDSTWQFRGDVRIRFASGNLQSDAATVSFTGNRIAHASISGTPARFEQRVENLPQPARGRAGNIEYNLLAGTVRLTQDAWLSDGRSEISSQVLVYNLKDQKVQTENRAESGPAPAAGTELGQGKGRVHITIRPPAETSPAPAPAPAP